MLDLDPVLLGHPEAAARWRRRRRAAAAAAAGGTHAELVSSLPSQLRIMTGDGGGRAADLQESGTNYSGVRRRSMLMPSLPTDRGGVVISRGFVGKF